MNVIGRFRISHGIHYEKRLTIPDDKAPKSLPEYIERSAKAMVHFWPTARIGPATDTHTTQHEVAVHGSSAGVGIGWTVAWRTDEYDAWWAETMALMDRGLLNPDPTNNDLSSAIERITGAKSPTTQGATK